MFSVVTKKRSREENSSEGETDQDKENGMDLLSSNLGQ